MTSGRVDFGAATHLNLASMEAALSPSRLPAVSKSTTVARNLGKVDNPFTASADGRKIFYPRIDSSVDNLMLVENFR